MERMYGGQRHKILLNQKEAKHEDELDNGIFDRRLLHKLTEKMVAQYHRLIFEHKKDENVETLRSFIIQEAEFHIAASETVDGLRLKKKNYKKKKKKCSHSCVGAKEQEKKSVKMRCLWFESSFLGL